MLMDKYRGFFPNMGGCACMNVLKRELKLTAVCLILLFVM